MLVNEERVTIQWGQCDPAGIVYFPRYFEILDNCVNALFLRATGLTKFEMMRKYNVQGYPSVDNRCKFSKPCKFGDVVLVQTQITEFRRSSFDIHHRLTHLDGSLSVEGFDTRVWVGRDPADPDRIKSVALPDDLIAAFA